MLPHRPPEDVRAVLENDGDGIGLLRSEFLYLNAKTYSTEDELSVSPDAVIPQRSIIRNTDMSGKREKILEALESGN